MITVNFTHSSVARLPWGQPSSKGLSRARRESGSSLPTVPLSGATLLPSVICNPQHNPKSLPALILSADFHITHKTRVF